MNPTPRRFPVWKPLLGVLLTLTATTLGLWGWIERLADRRWAAFLKRHAELREEARKQDGRRPVLSGEPIPGSAWDDYLPVLRPSSVGYSHIEIPEFGKPFPAGAIEGIGKYRAKMLPDLLRFLQGTRRENGDYPYRWEKGTDGASIGNLWEWRVVTALQVEARLLVQEGKPLDAAEVLLSQLQFARDLASHSTLSMAAYAQQFSATILKDLRALIVSVPIRDPNLREIERRLEVLDASYPKEAPLWTNELIVMGFELMKPEGGFFGGSTVPRSSLWRYGYSLKIAAADAFARADEWRRIRGELENNPWDPGRDPRLAACITPKNALFDHAQNRLYYGYGSSRSARAPLRLLRVAAHYRATGEWLDLDDPYGDKLHHAIDGNKLRAWSVGVDGKDDGGKGVWQTLSAGQDLVIEVTR